ncbi:phosphopantetheine-binding protein [Amycolatopsis sp. lyj-90]|uniref:phosphopantetheine-binding protein n=1 Tax=Amycolatopsis sp. lyj-90 TaxID=2789285 RepID=UPI00397AC944
MTDVPSIDEMREMVAAMTGADPAGITPTTSLLDLGVGSLEMMRLVNRFRRAGLAVEFRVLSAHPTLGAWMEHVATVTART